MGRACDCKSAGPTYACGLDKEIGNGRRFFFGEYEDRQESCHAVTYQQLGGHDHVQRERGHGCKNKVRDILTEAYEERFQKEFIPCGQAL